MLIINSITLSSCISSSLQQQGRFLLHHFIINSITLSSCISSSLQQQGCFLQHHAHHQQPHLVQLHFLQLTTTRSLSRTSCSSSTASPCPAAFPPAYNNKVAFSYIISSSTASPCPAAFPPAYNNKVAFSYIMLIINSNTLPKLHFLQLATKRYSSLFHSSLISVAPSSTKWQNLSHFA
jgi:hypothetical protein